MLANPYQGARQKRVKLPHVAFGLAALVIAGAGVLMENYLASSANYQARFSLPNDAWIPALHHSIATSQYVSTETGSVVTVGEFDFVSPQPLGLRGDDFAVVGKVGTLKGLKMTFVGPRFSVDGADFRFVEFTTAGRSIWRALGEKGNSKYEFTMYVAGDSEALRRKLAYDVPFFKEMVLESRFVRSQDDKADLDRVDL